MRNPYDILKKPRVTEKGSMMAEEKSVVVFEVPLDANKAEIKKAVRTVFNVEVEGVRTMIMRGKLKRRGRHIGRRSNWKKAVVKLAEGHDIDFFGGTA